MQTRADERNIYNMRRELTDMEYYNEDRKNRYIKQRESEGNFSKHYFPRLFKRCKPYEEKYGKDLCEFTSPEIENMLKTISYNATTTLVGDINQYAVYTDWCLAQGFVPDSQNHFREINRKDATRYINKATRRRGFVTPEQIKQWEKVLNNSSDKVLLWLVFYGFTYEEIAKIRESDLNRENCTVDTCNRTGVVLSYHLIELMFESAAETIYYPVIGEGKKIKLENSDFVIKSRVNAIGNDYHKQRRIYTRVKHILSEVGDEFASIPMLKKSGFVWTVEQAVEKAKQEGRYTNLKEFCSTKEFIDIASQYGNKSMYYSDFMLRCGDLINIQD